MSSATVMNDTCEICYYQINKLAIGVSYTMVTVKKGLFFKNSHLTVEG